MPAVRDHGGVRRRLALPLPLLLLLLASAGLGAASSPPSVVLVGATGNLAGKYLWQSLFELHRDGRVGRVYGGATKAPDVGTPLIEAMLDKKLVCRDRGPDCAQDIAAFRADGTRLPLAAA